MPVNPQFTARSGATTFMNIAKTLCRIVQTSAPLIRARFPTRVALLAVLTAAEGVCELLPAAVQEQAAADALASSAFYPAEGTPISGQDTDV